MVKNMQNLPKTISRGELSDVIKTLEINNAHAKASISLWGAHILSFKPKHDNRERLFRSNKMVLDGTRSLRGGVPVCWPWFAQRPGFQMHGYVRMRNWHMLSATENANYTEIVLTPYDTTGDGFDGTADLTLTVQVGERLSFTLMTTNTGEESFEFNTALHTYFAVEDINEVELTGLSGSYLDKPQDFATMETPAPYRFTEETDRIHLNPVKQVSIMQPGSETGVESAGHDSIVVWNPWAKNAAGLTDLGADGYLTMLCVETAVTLGKTLQSGESHSLTQVVS